MFKVNSKERKERKEGREGGRQGEREGERKRGTERNWDLFFTLTKVKTEAHLFLLVMEGS